MHNDIKNIPHLYFFSPNQTNFLIIAIGKTCKMYWTILNNSRKEIYRTEIYEFCFKKNVGILRRFDGSGNI